MSLQNLSANQLREKFLNFFEGKGHKRLPSSSLIPENDPSVLFTTAGMQQFKRYYDRPDEAPASRVVTCQKCIRTGDIEEVGDETHLTFFEMLGNFSFGNPKIEGSYFKKEAISYAWEFLTEIMGVDKERISCTYFGGDKGIPEDTQSKKLLEEITGLEDAKILGTGFDETFWSLGTEGSPGGPTVEFYIDGVEVWNLVFNQYKLQNGEYVESEYKGIDTGMGFERLIAKLNNAENVFETDLFALTAKKLRELSTSESEIDERIILDHLKSSVFIINDGIEPSNKGQGYILRRLIRRAIVKAKNIGIDQNFLSVLADEVFATYDNYQFDTSRIKSELEKEELKFRKTLENGLKILAKRQDLDGKTIFDLYQTYGLPVEVTMEEAKEKEINIIENAEQEFKNLQKEHQEKSRTASAGMFKGGLADDQDKTRNLHTAAHLLLASLRRVLGDHVMQKGSNITSERLRFDFAHPEKMTDEQIRQVEDLVNEQIKAGHEVICDQMSYEQAKRAGAMGVFEDKYGEKVKVYSISDFSKEICGGPHANNTSELGKFKIIKEESSSSGVRRIKAVLENF